MERSDLAEQLDGRVPISQGKVQSSIFADKTQSSIFADVFICEIGPTVDSSPVGTFVLGT